MQLRDALIQQAPSLELQRSAQQEIAKLDRQVEQLTRLVNNNAKVALEFKQNFDKAIQLADYWEQL